MPAKVTVFEMKKRLQPIAISKSEASYQMLMLETLSKLTHEIRDSNQLLRKVLIKGGHIDEISNSPAKPNQMVRTFGVNRGHQKSVNAKRESQEDENAFEVEDVEDEPQFEQKNSNQNKEFFEERMISVLMSIQDRLEKNQEVQLDLIKKLDQEQGKHQKHQKHQKHEKHEKSERSVSIGVIQQPTMQNMQSPQNHRTSIIENSFMNKVEREVEMKKNSMIIQEILPHSDRRELKIKFKLADVIDIKKPQVRKQLEQATSEWLGNVYRAVASICWNILMNNLLSFDEIKILFTENIVYNYIEFMNELREYKFIEEGHKLTALINEKSCDILDFLCKQYPQTKIEAPNITLRKNLPPIENQGRLAYDLVSCSAVIFTYREDKDYTPQIMRVINFMIESSNQQFEHFNKYITDLFRMVYIPNDKRSRGEESLEDLAYKESVKKYTNFKIGRKIPKNTLIYTDEEIQDGIFFVKSTPILRIVTKWVQELYEYFRQSEKKIKNSYDETKDHLGRPLYLSASLKNVLHKELSKCRKSLQYKIEQIKKECYLMESLLTSPQFTTDLTQVHLSAEQISVGKYCGNLKTSISAYLCSQLNELIHTLLEVPRNIDEKLLEPLEKQGEDENNEVIHAKTKSSLNKINFVTSKVFDLLRCKCHSNEQEIIWILSELLRRSKEKKQFEIVRVKDRLNEGTRDILINAQIGGGLVCEIQLSVTSTTDKKQDLLDMYNHFLYELKRSNLGPITENVSIWATLEQRFTYFEKLRQIKRIKANNDMSKHNCDGQLVPFTRPIICQACLTFYAIPQSCLLGYKCNSCSITYCGECYYQCLKPEQRKRELFGKDLFPKQVMESIKQYTNFNDQFPKNGFFIKKFFLKKELSFYMTIMKNSKTSPNSNDEEIMVVQTILRKEGIINRQIHRKPIHAEIKDKKIYIKNYQSTQLSQLIILYFPNESFKKIMPLSELHKILMLEENHKKRIVNIIKEPSYIVNMRFLRTELEKTREMNTLLPFIDESQGMSITAYIFNSFVILAQVCIKGTYLRQDLTRKINIKALKDFASRESDIISMESSSMTIEFELLPKNLSSQLLKNIENGVRKLLLASNNISSLESISNIKNLEFLIVTSNALTSLKGVEQMYRLLSIRFNDNKVTSLVPLSNLMALDSIYGDKNKLKSLVGVEKIESIRVLSVNTNEITSISPIKNLKYLKQLQINENPVTTLEGIQNKTELEMFLLNEVVVRDLKSISNIKSLKHLSLQGLELKQVPAILSRISLLELYLPFNSITQISNLDEQTELTILNLKANMITNIENLNSLVRLEALKIDKNQIKKVCGIKHLDNLKYLNLENNPIEDVGELASLDFTFELKYSKNNLVMQKFYEEFTERRASFSDQD